MTEQGTVSSIEDVAIRNIPQFRHSPVYPWPETLEHMLQKEADGVGPEDGNLSEMLELPSKA